MPKIKLEGMEKLQVKLKKNVQMSDIKRVVKENGKDFAGGVTEKSASGYRYTETEYWS